MTDAAENVADASSVPQSRKSLFNGETLQEGGTTVYESYLFKGTDEPALFKRHPSLLYGLYVPRFMDQRELPVGVEWGYGEPRNALAVLDRSAGEPGDLPDSDSELRDYREYLGSDYSDADALTDYFAVQDGSHGLIIRFTYTAGEKKNARNLFMSMIGSLSVIHDRAAFKPGVFLAYDESTFDKTQLIALRRALASMKAIVAKDAKAFADSLESPGLADALDFFLEDGSSYRFDQLVSISPLDGARMNVNVHYRMLSEEGFLRESGYAFTVRQNKAGEWKVANID